MPGRWENSTRRSQLPADWPERRFKVRLRAGGRCEWVDAAGRCPQPGTDCDHIDRFGSHELDNLQWLCRPHHNEKSSAEGNAAPRVTSRRPPEEHPAFR